MKLVLIYRAITIKQKYQIQIAEVYRKQLIKTLKSYDQKELFE